MAFYKTPIFEEPPTCLVCSVVVTDGSLICSATCSDISARREGFAVPEMDEVGEFDCV